MLNAASHVPERDQLLFAKQGRQRLQLLSSSYPRLLLAFVEMIAVLAGRGTVPCEPEISPV